MSRLNKFKQFLTQEEAAALLGLLINEEVSASDIERLQNDWEIGRAVQIPYGQLVKLEPCRATVKSAEVMRIGEVVGECYGFHYPCETVTVGDDLQVCSLRGASGTYYAVAVPPGNLITLADYENSGIESKLIDPREIYRIAKIANDDNQTKPFKVAPLLNFLTVCEEEIYDFLPGEEPPKHAPPKLKLVKQTNSQLLAIASLIDIARERSGKNSTQDALIEKILKRADGKRGLSESGLQKLFADANNAAKDWKD
ncbi:hypothetical protein [Pseudomonas sp. NBRC 100443]|uniref:hypothetical protein n=1 Tax=Pseudomonas sp. NBRC 100443 TaxID=1113665 RepID=UPI0024A230CC|nr:hypothetical protein [Pseudomonas sp. NBRC 100443]GLU41966.1 hypothetical protein Pssp01_60590 [Pseudomonas sp. NBRC 100443]